MRIVRVTALLSVVAVFSFCLFADHPSVVGADAGSDQAAPQPVEDDMHEFMEYVFEPTYKRLKAVMAAEPADNAAWKAIKSDSLILAEGANLLLIRGPKENAGAWNEYSAAVREHGGQFYRAAQQKDFAQAAAGYKTMLTHCNACHQKFADGKHQLTP
jgi:mono/diheme cytochrome c family protein